MATRARLYRMFLRATGTPPPVVDTMTPSQIAACLGLDETEGIEGDEYDGRARAVEHVPAPERADIDRSIPRKERMRLAAEAEAALGINDPELNGYQGGEQN